MSELFCIVHVDTYLLQHEQIKLCDEVVLFEYRNEISRADKADFGVYPPCESFCSAERIAYRSHNRLIVGNDVSTCHSRLKVLHYVIFKPYALFKFLVVDHYGNS